MHSCAIDYLCRRHSPESPTSPMSRECHNLFLVRHGHTCKVHMKDQREALVEGDKLNDGFPGRKS